jgi:hypothetical protein
MTFCGATSLTTQLSGRPHAEMLPKWHFRTWGPVACSSNDKQLNMQQCSLQSGNTIGFYKALSWEYSWFAPHDLVYLITLMGENVRTG